ncbi:helix-turn-helix domain-containing protein [Nocardia wallacei]|uniref:helix-turn-helix domain-containing protein n=1 Tax=Nocardia wallacei TaxID=480035 RepID=UPI002453D788|nr:helix-turn-helix transcriptional regulator [Nocardia wallacei]
MGTHSDNFCTANASTSSKAHSYSADAKGQPSLTRSCERVPNDRLITARLAVGWTQAELAEAVATHILQASGKTTGIDADYISRLERGLISWPSRLTRAALESLLGRSARELGLVNRRLGGPQRRRFGPRADGDGQHCPADPYPS